MLFTCKKFMFSDSDWKKFFLLYEMVGGGMVWCPPPPLSPPPFLYGPDMWKDIWRCIVRETFTWPNLLKGKDNNRNCAWKISFSILTFIYSSDLLSMMLRRLSAILWPKIWPVSTDFLLSGFAFIWYSPLTGQQVNWEAASDSFSFTSQTLTHKPDDYYREITNVRS